MELEKVIHEICSALEAIEKDDSLYEEASFGGRLEALDAVEISILPRVEGLAADKGQAETFLSLKQRAEMLKNKLEAVDEELFHKLRAGISSGALRGAELGHQIEAYAGGGRGKRSQGRGAYDSLDALISGVLLVEPPPAEASQREAEMVFYQPTPVRIILQLVDRACFQDHDTFYDLGSGLGQVVILVHLLSGVIAKGVEVDPAYCEYARRCAQDLNISGVDFIHADAREADYSDGTAFFLYTPFEGKMLQEVLARLRGEAERRRIDVYTYGPCTAEVSRQEWLRPVCQNVHRIDRLAAFTSACRHACGGPATCTQR